MGSCSGKMTPAGSAATEAYDDCVIIEATAPKTAAIIVLHGLGDNGRSFKEAIMDYGLFDKDKDFDGTKWIFPTAPILSITVNSGSRMNGWFDIDQFDDMQKPASDPPGIQESIDRIKRLIRVEVESGVPSHRIVVMGISQGGHVASKLALQAKPPLPACVLLSSWLEPIDVQVSKAGKKTKFFIGHGCQDSLIPVEQARLLKDNLGRVGCQDVEVREYAKLEHWMFPNELNDVADFLKTVLQ